MQNVGIIMGCTAEYHIVRTTSPFYMTALEIDAVGRKPHDGLTRTDKRKIPVKYLYKIWVL